MALRTQLLTGVMRPCRLPSAAIHPGPPSLPLSAAHCGRLVARQSVQVAGSRLRVPSQRGGSRRCPAAAAAAAAAGDGNGAPPAEDAPAAMPSGKQQRRRNSHHPALEAINDATKWAVSSAAFGALLWRRDLVAAWGILGSILAAINCRVRCL